MVGLPLRPTEVLVFGKARSHTPRMQSNQTMEIYLPLRCSFGKTREKVTWLSYNDPDWLARRHGLDDQSRLIDGIQGIINAVVEAASFLTVTLSRRQKLWPHQ